MARQHIITERINDVIFRGDLLAWLKEKGMVPKEWGAVSIQVSQSSASDEIEVTLETTRVADK